MNKIWVIARKDIGEAFRSRSTYVFIVIMLFLTFSYVSSYHAHVNTLNAASRLLMISAASFSTVWLISCR